MPRSRQRFSNPSAVKQLPRSVRMRVTRKGKAAIASSRKALAAASVSSSLTARWTRRERRSMATNRKRLRHSPSAVRSLGRCFTSTWTKPTSYSLNLPAAFSGVARTGRRLRPSALRMRYTWSRPRCGRKCRTTKVRSSSGKPVARRRAQTTARSSPLPFHGSLGGRLDRSRQSATPRLRHLRTVSVLTPKRPASSPVGSLERAISARTAGVVRALGWIESIRPSLQPRALVRGRRSATRTPRSPNALGPNNVPQPDNYPKGPHDQPQSMCPSFGSLRVGLRMRRTATILSGSACCVYGLTFTSHFYGARRSVGYVPFNSETLVTGKLFEDIREAVFKLADPDNYDAIIIINLCVPTASGVPLRLLPREIDGVRII